MAVAYIFMIFTILPLARYMARMVLIETTYLAPIIILVTIVAAFGERQYLFDMGARAGLRRDRLHRAQDQLPRDRDPHRHHARAALRAVPGARAAPLARATSTILFSSTLGNVLWALLVLSLVLPLLQGRFSRSSRPQP